MQNDDHNELARLITAVSQASKYRHIAPDLIKTVGAQELEKRRSFKEAVKATKNKLHQVGGAYQESKIDYARALDTIDPENLHQSCREVMRLHRSTAERLPILDEFYTTIFAELEPVQSILDIASGLNPLALPWMDLPNDVAYTAVDIYADMIDFLNQFFAKIGVNGNALVQDVVFAPPEQPVDCAFILKTLPVLEQLDKLAVLRLFDKLNARQLVISFPLQSLGGRKKGMEAHYAAQFAAQFERWENGRSWHVKPLHFSTELVYIVTINS